MTLAEHEAYLARPDLDAEPFEALTAEILALDAGPTPRDAIVRLVECQDLISDRQYHAVIRAICAARRARANGTVLGAEGRDGDPSSSGPHPAPPFSTQHPAPSTKAPLGESWGRKILIAAVVLVRERCGPTEALARAGTLERVLVRTANRLRGVRE